MPRSRRSNSGGRVTNRNARRFRSAPPPSAFDDDWLSAYSQRSRNRYVDLTRYEDRRFWSPQSVNKLRVRTLGSIRGPRIVVVPEGHKLARKQTYGGRYSLQEVLDKRRKWQTYGGGWTRSQWEHGSADVWRREVVSRRLGFHAPWQVIVCVRRQRRREVLMANFLRRRGGMGSMVRRIRKVRRNEFSEIRC